MAELKEMVLKVDLQCSKCYKKVKKVLCKFPEIRDQVYDEKQNTVTIKVVSCCPERLMQKIRCKGCKVIKSIEIKQPKKPDPPKPQKEPPPPAPTQSKPPPPAPTQSKPPPPAPTHCKPPPPPQNTASLLLQHPVTHLAARITPNPVTHLAT
ncbi:protein PYRICULARIA ORYZAE RESISTANCE 21-like [Mangifera indica]|uniref:protein PYRICULARIA ORYZAE RESISTANCE 21-like n=1 Tax=Mangifera indica TaxID=29780 RepID=UPI001CFBC43D|nr:protein PYRICULARIA ORYZAE RESISTANCE 21-like [Mangifera indica]